MNNIITLDIESEKIIPGSPLLPRPVGVAIRWQDGRSQYYAWGHPAGNNMPHSELSAAALLRPIWGDSSIHILTHNGSTFDIPDLEHYFGLPKIDPLRVHDTLFLAYLHNPHAKSLHLKDLAKDLCGIEATEREELQDWILANVPECKSRKQCGAHISKAPGDLVGRYASADVTMTWELYQLLAPKVLPLMQEPYDRERRLAPILADIQNRGIRVSVEQLKSDYERGQHELAELDNEIRTVLKTPDLSIDSNDSLVQALQLNGYTGFALTETGKLSANKASMANVLKKAPELADALARRGALATLTSTFMGPWLDIAAANGGRIHASSVVLVLPYIR